MKHQIIRNHNIVIGIEIHVQLSTTTKMFSHSPAVFGQKANSCANMIDCGLPGVLPQPNKEAFHKAIAFGLMTNAIINRKSAFSRKNYFYPDLPKGYQITQDREPIVIGGEIELKDYDKTVRIHHAHLEEDAGKTNHGQVTAGIDLNRAGSTLLEIVSEPDMYSIAEAIAYLKTVHALVKYINISDANMQEGSFRADINISVRKSENAPLGTRTEIKNLNSFRFIEKALNYEINRQIDCLERGESIKQETRLFHEQTGSTRSMRSKEDAHDYRYFPEPDLCPIIIDENTIKTIQQQLPEQPEVAIAGLIENHGLAYVDAKMIIYDNKLSSMFNKCLDADLDAKMSVNWLTVNLQTLVNKHQIATNAIPFSDNQFIELLTHIKNEDISGNTAKKVLEMMWNNSKSPTEIIKDKGLKQITDEGELTTIVNQILDNNQQQIQQSQQNPKLIEYFVGQAMKHTRGQAKPDLLKGIVVKCLGRYNSTNNKNTDES